MPEAGPERIVFVGGAPRSGTTVAHALICSAPGVSDYHPEISFLRGFANAYRNGVNAWKEHTSAFFEDREAFRRHMRVHTDLALDVVWRATGRTPILACKDPLLTGYFPDLREVHADNGQFVVVIRHPFDIVRSRQEVHEKGGAQHLFSAQQVEALANDYLGTYRAILSKDFGGRLFLFRYEDLNEPKLREALCTFIGVETFDPDRMWGKGGNALDGAWGSPKYNGPIDLGRRLDALDPAFEAIVRRVCAPLMQRFNYD